MTPDEPGLPGPGAPEAPPAANPSPAEQAGAAAPSPLEPAAAPGPLAPANPLPGGLAAAPVGGLATEAPEQENREVDHSEPILTGGAAGDDVERLVKLLAFAGYGTNTIVQGENHARILDNSVMADVRRFWIDHPDAREPDELAAGQDANAADLAAAWIGPHTWQKLYEIARGDAEPASAPASG